MICSLCCGQHRLGAIKCPADCVHLGGLDIVRDPSRAVAPTRSDYRSVWDKLREFRLGAADFMREVAAKVGDGTPWDQSIAVAYVHHGHRRADGSRLIDSFIAQRARALSAGEAAAIVALQRALTSLFEIDGVQQGVGFELRDVLSGQALQVHEITGSAHLSRRDVLFGWVMDAPGHRELTGAVFRVDRAHVDRVHASLGAALVVARTRWPQIADADLVGSIAWAVFEAIDAARDDEGARREAGVVPPSYAFDADADDDPDPGEFRINGSYDPNHCARSRCMARDRRNDDLAPARQDSNPASPCPPEAPERSRSWLAVLALYGPRPLEPRARYLKRSPSALERPVLEGPLLGDIVERDYALKL
jgi:hypothetical protein